MVLGGSLLGVLVLVLAGLRAARRHAFRYVPAPLSETEFQQLAQRGGFQAVTLQAEPGVQLRGLVRAPRALAAGWLLYFPGNGAGQLAGGHSLLTALDPGPGWGLAVFAYRGFDGSGGRPSRAAFEADAGRVWRHLAERHGAKPGQAHLVSFSLGTALALGLAGQLAAAGTPVASLLLLAAYDRITVRQPRPWGDWWPADDFDAIAAATGVAAPALLVHGEQDAAVPLAAARHLAQALAPHARLRVLPGRGHGEWLADPAVQAELRRYLQGGG